MEHIVALGAENKTAFSVMSNKGLFTGDIMDNIRDPRLYNEYETSLRKYMEAEKVVPGIIVCDMHPGYCSTSLAERLRDEFQEAKLVKVQHHFAHIVSCMCDNDIDERVTGVSFDGTGYGSDGKSWGGEFLICTRKDFERKYHLKYISQPGGDAAAREGWRMAVAYLYDSFGRGFLDMDLPLFRRTGSGKAAFIKNMIDKRFNSPLTSSLGRLFDAVASLAGICDRSEYEAEAAIMLESCSVDGIDGRYGYDIVGDEIDCSKMIRQIVKEVKNGSAPGVISSRFHNTVGALVFDISHRIYAEYGIKKVLISGGCFQNRYLTGYIENRFKGSELRLYKHNRYSPTDLGISVGQAVIAANNANLVTQDV